MVITYSRCSHSLSIEKKRACGTVICNSVGYENDPAVPHRDHHHHDRFWRGEVGLRA